MFLPMEISIIVPFFNEESNINLVIDDLITELKKMSYTYELLLVNDASSDNSAHIIQNYSRNDQNIKLINNPLNVGQGFSICNGIKKAKYNYIAIMDGDFQYRAKDLIFLFQEIESSNLDLVCGSRNNRKDANLRKKLPSYIGNILISKIFNTKFTDIGCAIKIGKANYFKDIEPFKNIHRYINILITKQGGQYRELNINHYPRVNGTSHYSSLKFVQIIFEVLWLKFYYLKKING